jgi:carbon monoxide dehydrogenase subunit G
MAKFPARSEASVTIGAPIARAYKFLWNVLAASECIPGIASCKRAGKDTYRFVFEPRSTGPVSLVVRYTARYEGNGEDEIQYSGNAASSEDNTDIDGVIRLEAKGKNATRVTIRQTVSPDTPVPKLLQALVRSFVEKEASRALEEFLDNARARLEARH